MSLFIKLRLLSAEENNNVISTLGNDVRIKWDNLWEKHTGSKCIGKYNKLFLSLLSFLGLRVLKIITLLKEVINAYGENI